MPDEVIEGYGFNLLKRLTNKENKTSNALLLLLLIFTQIHSEKANRLFALSLAAAYSSDSGL